MRWVALVGTLAVTGSLGLAGCDGDDHKNQAPVAVFSASPQAGPTPLSVTLDASASTDKEDRIESYDWVTGDGATLSGVTVTHTYERPGEFTVTLTVTDHKGKTSTASQVVTVENRPPVAAFTATPEAGTAPLVVVFDASASNDPDGSIEQYAWEFPAGTASGAIVEHRFEEPGEFEVTLRVTDDFGASANALSTIRVEELPKYQILDLGTLGGTWAEGLAINDAGQVTGHAATPRDVANPRGRVHAFVASADQPMMDLGTLGGGDSAGYDINNAGQVTGLAHSDWEFGYYRAFVASVDQPMVDLGTIEGPYSSGAAINEAGQVTGFSTSGSGVRAFLVTVGQPMVNLGTLGGGGSSGADINDVGQVTGSARTVDGEERAFVATVGEPIVDLGTLGGSRSAGVAINDAGQATGTAETADGEEHAFVASVGEPMVDLGTLGGSYSRGNDINNAGQVTGLSGTAEKENHAFIASAGAAPLDLGTLGGYRSEGMAINDAGQVTGMAETIDGEQRAFVASVGEPMVDLGTLGGSSSQGWDINNVGQVTGRARTANGEDRAVLWTPIGLLFERIATDVETANLDSVLSQQIEAAGAAYSARDGACSCAALDEFEERIESLGVVVLGEERVAKWTTKSQEISDALHCP